ncbi:hypothetical protein C8Q73DRAFT_368893 [Cubamyces lactineus]|nr:hypothetical protein C8Q73DRAFT_368893 [Cubamyces lactineus]
MHECPSKGCSEVRYVFRILKAPRKISSGHSNTIICHTEAAMAGRPATGMGDPSATSVPVEVDPVANFDHESAYLELAGTTLRHTIIRECQWEQAMSMTSPKDVVCAICGRLTPPEKATCEQPSQVNLHLLRNDVLPEEVLPTTYNRAAYHPVISESQTGVVQACPEGDCYGSGLVQRFFGRLTD